MNYSSIRQLFFAAFALAAGLSVSAQYRLPQSHSNQHSDLIANQRPAGVDFNKIKLSGIINDVSRREALQDNEVFSYNWESQSVNAYVGAEIPQTRNIDVTGYVAPVPGAVTSPYGWRPRFGRMHRGVDLRLSVGDTVVSAFDGKVRLTKYEGRGYGYYVVVRHDNGLETVYGHLSKFLVKPNQRVRAGEPIALGGNTGRSTGPHLHFETRFMGLAVNPATIIDFENLCTHKDVFTFDKTSYERSQVYGPKKHKGSKKWAKKSKRRNKNLASKSSKKKKSKKRRR